MSTTVDPVFGPAPPLSERDKRLVEVYERTHRTLDDLPYTAEFEDLYTQMKEYDSNLSKHKVFQRLLTLRKAARLPRLGRSTHSPIYITQAEEEKLSDLVPIHTGTMGQRDRLPYTQEFDSLVESFNRETGRDLSHHHIWRLMSRVAK